MHSISFESPDTGANEFSLKKSLKALLDRLLFLHSKNPHFNSVYIGMMPFLTSMAVFENYKTKITLGFFPTEILLLMCFCHIKHHRDVAVFCHDFSFSRHIYSLLDACSLAHNSRQKKTLLYKYIDIPKEKP